MAKFKKVSADEVQAKRTAHTKSAGGGTAIMKASKAPPSWNATDRSARFVMSSESEDRYKDIVVQAGIDITRFMQNPQGLLFHNSRTWPCGLWSDVTKVASRPKRMEGTLNFVPAGVDEDADRAARHVAAGTLRTVSIGFIPDWDNVDFILDDDEDWTGGFRFNASELIECSLVPIPAQPDALVKDAGGDMKLARELIENVLDNYAKSPEGLLLPMDEYRAKHFDLGGSKTSVIVDKDLNPISRKFSSLADMKMKATTDEEAKSFVGAKVSFDPSHEENKGYPYEDVLAKATGEVLASFIVDEGPKKGVHGLWVEFLENDYQGMFRGIAADRFVMVKSGDDGDDEEGEDDLPVVESDEEKKDDTNAEEDGEKSVDDVADMPMKQVNLLAERDVLFATKYKSGDTIIAGNIIAKSIEDATAIAEKRGLGEEVLGWIVKVGTDSPLAEIRHFVPLEGTTSEEQAKAIAKHNTSTTAQIAAGAITAGTITVSDAVIGKSAIVAAPPIDTSEAHKQIDGLEKRIDSVVSKLKKFFVGSGEEETVVKKIDPVLNNPIPATEEEMDAAKLKAKAAIERLASKGVTAG